MAEQKLETAVREVLQSSRQAVVSDACRDALAEGSNEAMTRALVFTRETATTWVAKGIANRALGFKDE